MFFSQPYLAMPCVKVPTATHTLDADSDAFPELDAQQLRLLDTLRNHSPFSADTSRPKACSEFTHKHLERRKSHRASSVGVATATVSVYTRDGIGGTCLEMLSMPHFARF